MSKEDYVRIDAQLILKPNPNGVLLIPKRGAKFYIMSIKPNRRFERAKAWVMKKLLSFCENVLAN